MATWYIEEKNYLMGNRSRLRQGCGGQTDIRNRAISAVGFRAAGLFTKVNEEGVVFVEQGYVSGKVFHEEGLPV
jgi:hypothetical protein